MSSIQFKDLIKYRSVCMAFAIIWVVSFHAGVNIPFPFSFIKEVGYGGVDIFLFASGIGVYYSLSKEKDMFKFLSKRAKKTLVMYYVFLSFFVVYKIYFNEMRFIELVGNLIIFGYFANLPNQFNWYVPVIWLLYLISPLAVEFVNKTKHNIKLHIITIIVLILFSFCYFNTSQILWTTRTPIFFMGICFASYFEDKNIQLKKSVIVSSISFLLGFSLLVFSYEFLGQYLWTNGLFWYPFIIVTPGLFSIILLVSYFLDNSGLKPIIKLARFIGNNTFSIFLVHILIFDFYHKMVDRNVIVTSSWYGILGIIMIIPAAYLLNLLTKKVICLIFHNLQAY